MIKTYRPSLNSGLKVCQVLQLFQCFLNASNIKVNTFDDFFNILTTNYLFPYCFINLLSFRVSHQHFSGRGINTLCWGGHLVQEIEEATSILTYQHLSILVHFLRTLNMEIADGIFYCLNLNLSMYFGIGFSSPVTFKAKPYVTAVNYSFHTLHIFCQEELHLTQGLN